MNPTLISRLKSADATLKGLPAKPPVSGIDLTKLESVAELVEGLEERRERIQEIKARGWA